MKRKRSEIFTERQLRAMERIGDILLPRTEEMPSFSETGCIEHIDHVARHAPEKDIQDLKGVLTILSFTPTFKLRWLVGYMCNADEWFEPAASLLRMLNIGLRGLICGCYYSGRTGKEYTGPSPLERIGFSINKAPRDGVPMRPQP